MKPTPVLTQHARDRCAEMGISTKVAKRVLRHADLTRPAKPGQPGIAATSTLVPGYAVIYKMVDDNPRPLILTVLFDCRDFVARNGSTYIAEEAS